MENPTVNPMPPEDGNVISESYRKFRSPVSIRRDTAYEKAARAAGKLLKIGTKNRGIWEAIEFAHLNIKPGDVASLTMLVAVAAFLPMVIYGAGALAGFEIDILLAVSLTFAGVAASYYAYTNPKRMKKRYEMTVGADMISSILYMVIYMRNTPSIDGAVDFAARNTTGGMQAELQKIIWDVRVGNYLNIEDALLDYAEKWKGNREFGEAIGLIINSTRQSGERSGALLDEAVRVVLEGNKETSQNYVAGLRMPLMAVNALGILLPIMGLVLFPVISIFLGVGSVPLLVMYDILLPTMLFFLIAGILEKRPVTFSRIDVSRHPKLPPQGKFFIGKAAVSAAKVAAVVFMIIAAFSFILYSAGLECADDGGREVCEESESLGFFIISGQAVLSFPVLSALMFALALGLAPGVYFRLISRDRKKLREDVRLIESEFREALFQLGTRIRSGVPLEKAMIESLKRIEGLKIRDMFQKAARNMQKFSMTFERAFFDREQGAIRYYPSALIESVMKAVAESAKKGPENAGAAMVSISRYLRDLHSTQEYVRKSMQSVTSSIKFQAYVLTPLITGVIATMAIVIIRILEQLQLQQQTISGIGSLPFAGGFIFEEIVITPFQFVIVVSIFIAQALFLYGYLLSGVEVGEDSIYRAEILSGMFLMSPVIYAVISVVSLLIFGPLTQFSI